MALYLALLAFAASPSVLGAGDSHCGEGEQVMEGIAKNQCITEAKQSSTDESRSSNDNHVHCNPAACHFALVQEVATSFLETHAVLDEVLSIGLISIHLDSFPRPPSC